MPKSHLARLARLACLLLPIGEAINGVWLGRLVGATYRPIVSLSVSAQSHSRGKWLKNPQNLKNRAQNQGARRLMMRLSILIAPISSRSLVAQTLKLLNNSA